MEYIIMVTGSRDLKDYPNSVISGLLRTLIISKKYNNYSHLRIICGDAKGVDEEVFRICIDKGIPFTVYKTGVGKEYEVLHRGAMFRNELFKTTTVFTGDKMRHSLRDFAMIDLCDEVIGICIDNSSGTMKNIEYAKEKGKNVYSVHLP